MILRLHILHIGIQLMQKILAIVQIQYILRIGIQLIQQ